MSVFLFALALLTADAPAAEAAEAPPAPAIPVGAPSDDYGLVAWCYGALGGYLDLHDQVMPEVIRIESTYRKPGTRLADDLKVYADLQTQSRANLKLFASAIEAAERASLQPISAKGADAVRKGKSVWSAASTVSKARLAQEWMSWALPAVCVSTAKTLETRARLLGATFDPSEGAAEPVDAARPEIAVGEADAIDRLLEPAAGPEDASPDVAPAADPASDSGPSAPDAPPAT